MRSYLAPRKSLRGGSRRRSAPVRRSQISTVPFARCTDNSSPLSANSRFSGASPDSETTRTFRNGCVVQNSIFPAGPSHSNRVRVRTEGHEPGRTEARRRLLTGRFFQCHAVQVTDRPVITVQAQSLPHGLGQPCGRDRVGQIPMHEHHLVAVREWPVERCIFRGAKVLPWTRGWPQIPDTKRFVPAA